MNVNKDYESQLPGQGRAVASAFGMNMGSDTPEDLPPMRYVKSFEIFGLYFKYVVCKDGADTMSRVVNERILL